MDHAMPVDAEESEIDRLCFMSRSQGRHRLRVMALDEAVSSKSLSFPKVETTSLASERPRFLQRLDFAPLDNPTISLTEAMETSEHGSFLSLVIPVHGLKWGSLQLR